MAYLLKEIRAAADAIKDAAEEERRLLVERRAAPARLSLEDIGAIAVELAFDWSWIDRREQFIEFVEATTVRRNTRVHFTFPQALVRDAQRGTLIAVPLDILLKGDVLLHAEVRDEDDRLLSPLNKDKNGALSGYGLAAFFGRRMGAAFPIGAADLMMTVAANGGGKAQKALVELLDMPALSAYLTADPEQEVQAKLLTDDLKDGFLWAVMVEYRPGEMRVLEYAYDVRQAWRDPNATKLDKVAVAVGALPRRITFSNTEIGRAVSHHIEVIAPEETDIAGARIKADRYDSAAKAIKTLQQDADKQSRSRAQFHVPLLAGIEASNDAERARKRVLGRADNASVTVALMPRAGGVLAAVLLSSAATSAALIAFAFSLTHLDGQTSGAILLLIPVVVAAYLIREGEHPYTTRSLVGIRALAAISAVCGFLVALIIASEGFTGRSATLESPATTTATAPAAPSSAAQSTTRTVGAVTIRAPNTASTSRLGAPPQGSTTMRQSTNKGSRSPKSGSVNQTHSSSPRLRPIWKRVEWTLASVSTAATLVLMVAMASATLIARRLEKKVS